MAATATGSSPTIAIAGAGSVGCYVGGMLAAAGHKVRLLLRPTLADAIARHGMRVTDLDGADRVVPPGRVLLATEPAGAFAGADVILVTVKSGDTEAMARSIAAHSAAETTVVSLQNGVDNVGTLGAVLGSGRVVPGMVAFNVVQTRAADRPPRFHRSTGGTLHVRSGVPGLAKLLDLSGLGCAEHADMTGVQWSKLVLNMNNAINALSGLPLRTELSDRAWRVLLARQVSEALGVIGKSGIRLARIDGVHPAILPFVLRLPDALFRLVAARMLRIDPEATSSMAEDLSAGRRTEVDYLQGAVVRLARQAGVPAPVSEALVGLVREAEATGRRYTSGDVSERLRALSA